MNNSEHERVIITTRSDDDEWIDVQHSSDEGGGEADGVSDNEENDETISDGDVGSDGEESGSDEEEDGEEEEEEEEDEEQEEEGGDNNKKQSKDNKVKIKSKNVKIQKGKTENDDSISTSRKVTVNIKKLQKKSKRSKLERKKRKLEEKLKLQEKLKAQRKVEYTAEKKAKASQVSAERVLTDEDFRRIDMALVKQQVTHAKRGIKRPLEEDKSKGELVKLTDIENIYKKRKHDKQARIESVQKGQEGREKFGYKDGRQNPLCSKTNRERSKKKNFQMIKHKVKRKVKRSFKDKQISLRNHLVKLKRMK